MVGYVDVRAYAELNEFVELQARGLTVRRPFRSHQTVKDVLEAMGIPHTEVDLILVNGDPAGLFLPAGRRRPHCRLPYVRGPRHRVDRQVAPSAVA